MGEIIKKDTEENKLKEEKTVESNWQKQHDEREAEREATNSLDKETEQALIDTIVHLRERYTLIVIAHNSSALQRCDRVIDLSELIDLSD